MTVALTAPQVQDLPAKVLSPAQYYNYTQPRGNFIPYSVVRKSASSVWSGDANAEQLVKTFRLPSGVAATCVLRAPFNSSYDSDILKRVNTTYRNFRLLDKYFVSSCQSVFVGGLPLQNFVPPAVTVSPLVVKNDSLPPSFGASAESVCTIMFILLSLILKLFESRLFLDFPCNMYV